MAKKVNKRAVFHREMYPGVRFCERCWSHHNLPACPFSLAAFKPTQVILEDVPMPLPENERLFRSS